MQRPTAWQVLAAVLIMLAGSCVALVATAPAPPPRGAAAQVIRVLVEDVRRAPSPSSLSEQLSVDADKLLDAGVLLEAEVRVDGALIMAQSRPPAPGYQAGSRLSTTVQQGGASYQIDVVSAEARNLAGLRWRSRLVGLIAVVMLAIAAGGLVVSRRRHIQQQQITLLDPLTGVGNRRLLERVFTRLTGASDGVHHALLLLDIDGFKQVNDRYGHEHGDATLRRLTQALQDLVRPGDHVVRLGGDEFAVLLEDVPPSGAESGVLDGVLRRLRERLPDLGISGGGAYWPQDAADLNGLTHAADLAMYADKRRRRSLDVRRPSAPAERQRTRG